MYYKHTRYYNPAHAGSYSEQSTHPVDGEVEQVSDDGNSRCGNICSLTTMPVVVHRQHNSTVNQTFFRLDTSERHHGWLSLGAARSNLEGMHASV